MSEPLPETRLISGSEVSTWQTCQMKWWFQFRHGVQPLRLSDGLFVGTVGHEALSNYYAALKRGLRPEDAKDVMIDFVVAEIDKNNKLRRTGFITSSMAVERQALISKLSMILEAYYDKYAIDDYMRYEIVEVEHMHVSGNFFAMRLDLLLRSTENGCLILMDHKFIRDFYLEKQLAVNSQMPRYMKVVIGDHEENVSYALLNQIRTRDINTGWESQRAKIPYNETAANKRAGDQEIVASEIRKHYAMSKNGSLDKVVRTLSDYTCKFCAFWEPCSILLNGDYKGFKVALDSNFERSSYGYNK